MPKTHKRRSYRSGWHKRLRLRLRRFHLTFTNVGVFVVILAIIFAWWFRTHPFQAEAYPVQGPPTVSADFINQVLDHYHSPAANKGQALYDDGVKYGIDPVYALAFFLHESSFGTTGVATVTHSLGNIRATAGYRQYEGYRLYPTWEAGFEDWYKLIAEQYVAQWKLVTIDQIIPVYAPSTENDVDTYIQTVKHAVDTWRSGTIEV
nr:glucosaminidase domain-containing protein [Ktedonobacteraceae bacterium]